MTEITKKCCFTGHRPKDLPWGYNEESLKCRSFKVLLKNELIHAIKNGYSYFITGMAEGFDTIALEVLLELKEEGNKIFIEGAIPCIGQELKWNDASQKRYKENLKKLDKVTVLSNTYTSSCMLERNDYMLSQSSLVIACYSGGYGGTSSTIKKAKKLGHKLIILNPKEIIEQKKA